MTISLTKEGSKIRIISSEISETLYCNPFQISMVYRVDNTISLTCPGYSMVATVGSFTLGGVAVTNQATFETNLALVFPSANSSSGLTGDADTLQTHDASYFQAVNAKDATGGYAGLTLFKINFKNALNTFTSFFTNSNTAARTYTFQDRNGTIADDTDLGLKANSTSPTLVTPVLGVATATTINKVALTAPATGSTLTIADGKTLTASQSLTLAGTDSTVMTFPTTSATIARTDVAQTFTGNQTFSGAIISNTSLFPAAGAQNTIYHRESIVVGIGFTNNGNTVSTSGNRNTIQVNENFSPPSGTGTLNVWAITATTVINQTGGASGITTGIRFAPTLTAAADWRSVQIDNATGYAIYAGAAAKNYFNGITGVGAVPVTDKLEVTGNVALMAAGNKLKIVEGSNGSLGQTTLVSGTKAITITGLATTSRAIVTFVSVSGTVTTTWQYAAVCTLNTLTITALTTAGATNTSDTSVLNYLIIN